jgi:phosphoribosylamine--glycine ligase
MKVLVIGGGGREHAIAWKLAQSRNVEKVFCAPGNAGIARIAECIDIDPNDFEALVDFVKYEWVDLTIVGPEAPLSMGIVDAFEKEGRRIVGPTAAAARLESSKSYSKDFMKRYGIPTAEYRTFTSHTQAEDYVRLKGAPIVVKADGLAAGKGVIVAMTHDEAFEALKLIMKERAFGEAGDRVVLEECLTGEEASFMAFSDGVTMLPMVSSQDHKRIFDHDEGPNTGGMGAYSPAPVITPEVEAKIMDKVMLRALRGFKSEGFKYKGILYAGLMIKDGEPRVLEFNCRLGDPETQPVLMRLQTDLVEVAMGITDERLSGVSLKWRPEASVCVVLASGGYPGSYETGKAITGIEEAGEMEGVTVFHSGTAFGDDGVVTSGGRVLGVTALGDGIESAKKRAYGAIGKIGFEGMHCRGDISDKALGRRSGV